MSCVRSILPGGFRPISSIDCGTPRGLLGFPEGRELVGECFRRLWAKQDGDDLTIRVRETETYKRLVSEDLRAALDAYGEEITLRRHGRISITGNHPPRLPDTKPEGRQ